MEVELGSFFEKSPQISCSDCHRVQNRVRRTLRLVRGSVLPSWWPPAWCKRPCPVRDLARVGACYRITTRTHPSPLTLRYPLLLLWLDLPRLYCAIDKM